jgi:hypothetical protein
MLYITYTTSSDGCDLISTGWHVGQPNPINFHNVNKVVEVQADGDELLFIATQFRNIPMALKPSVVRWFGDDAKFIAANLG